MIRKTMFAVATVAAIGAAALIPTEASAGGGGKGGGMVVAWVAITAIGAMATASAASWSSDPAAGDGCPASAGYTSATKSTSTVSVLAEAPVRVARPGPSICETCERPRQSAICPLSD
jgi:hypothetical protein